MPGPVHLGSGTDRVALGNHLAAADNRARLQLCRKGQGASVYLYLSTVSPAMRSKFPMALRSPRIPEREGRPLPPGKLQELLRAPRRVCSQGDRLSERARRE